ncbi:hypothetical protein PsYK624_156930 [Phanerochaete sordida]|uniref:DUF6534 domain-containing protein n=1 Tax=Phanerochaete sordida TaxID=48140 RepID=A0A9P3LLD1_9APHY|nr:hypothetical protein PsYK624_156930 [Phanerochaete sordida]
MQFGSTLGTTLISGTIVAILYGTLNVQCYSFYHHYGLQSKYLASIVCLLWIFCTLHLVFTEINMYLIFVSNLGNVDLVVSASLWPVWAGSVVTVTTALVVQCWYCNRVWILSDKNQTLTYIPISMIVVSFGFGAATCAEMISKHGQFSEFEAIKWVALVTVASMSSADVYIATTLCVLLYKHRKHVLPRTSSVLNIVMIYTVSTGLLTSVVSVSFIIALLALSGTWVWVGEYYLFCGLYCNSLLAWLNARGYLRERLDYVFTLKYPIGQLHQTLLARVAQLGRCTKLLNPFQPVTAYQSPLCTRRTTADNLSVVLCTKAVLSHIECTPLCHVGKEKNGQAMRTWG